MRRSSILILAGGFAALLAGCSTATKPEQLATAPAAERQVQGALHDGGALLGCGASCADKWERSQAELARRYEAGDWVGLATLVLETDYRQDLAYFYLGRAAEGVGADTAALGYYRTAIALTTGNAADARCAVSAVGCGKVNLPNDAVLHISLAQQAQPHRVAASPHAPAQPQQAQPLAAQAQPQAAQTPPIQIAPAQPPSAETAAGTPARSADGWIDPPPANQ